MSIIITVPQTFGPELSSPILESVVGPAAFEQYVNIAPPMSRRPAIIPLGFRPSPTGSIEINVGDVIGVVSAPETAQVQYEEFGFQDIDIAKSKSISAGSAALPFSIRATFKIPAPAIGEELFGLSRLLGGGVSVRRVRPTPDQSELSRIGSQPPTRSQLASPPPPRGSTVANVDVAPKPSVFMQQHIDALQAAMRKDHCVFVFKTQSIVEYNRVALVAALQAKASNQRGASSASASHGVFDHIVDQEVLFSKLGCSKVAATYGAISVSSVISAFAGTRARPGGSAANPSRHSSSNRKDLLVDTDEVRPLTDVVFVESQIRDIEQHDFTVIRLFLSKLECIRGVDKDAQRCIGCIGALHDGRLLTYQAPVLDREVYPEAIGVPPLCGLDLLARDNASFCSKTGRMHCLLQHIAVDTIVWPQGIRTLQCERTHVGHLLLGVGHWDKMCKDEF